MQHVVVVPYDPKWPQDFARESALVAQTLGDLVLVVHHIGSTAIPGIHAKPIIDILAVVTNIKAIDGHNTQMQALGYESMGEFGMIGRRYFRKDDAVGN